MFSSLFSPFHRWAQLLFFLDFSSKLLCVMSAVVDVCVLSNRLVYAKVAAFWLQQGLFLHSPSVQLVRLIIRPTIEVKQCCFLTGNQLLLFSSSNPSVVYLLLYEDEVCTANHAVPPRWPFGELIPG